MGGGVARVVCERLAEGKHRPVNILAGQAAFAPDKIGVVLQPGLAPARWIAADGTNNQRCRSQNPP